MNPSPYMQISEHSPSVGPQNEIILNPDSRSSHQVEIDERRWHDKHLHRRVDSLIVEVGRVSDFIFLIAEKQDQLARDLAQERGARMAAEAAIREQMETHSRAVTEYIEIATGHLVAATDRITGLERNVTELQGVVAALSERTWWSMFQDSARTLFRKVFRKGE